MNKWLKLCITAVLLIIIPVVLFIVLNHAGITSIDNLRSIIESSGKWSIFLYILIQVVLLVFFCFVPALNTSLIILGIVLFGSKIAFFSCVVCIFFSSSILFFIGDKFGEKLISKIIGDETFVKLQNAIDTKSKIFLPFFFIIPGLPDEMLCLITGMTKIKYWYFILISLIYHAIEIGIICFLGSELINWSQLDTLGWIVVINIIVIDIYFLTSLEKWIEKKLERLKNIENQNKNNDK